MGIFLTADLHLNHGKVAQIRGFTDPVHMESVIKNNWNRRIKPQDEVWVLGDFALGDWRSALNRISDWNGYKYLVVGNHDRCSPLMRNWQAYYPDYLQAFQMVTTMGVLRRNNAQWILSHYPYTGDRGEDRHTQFRVRDEGTPIFHGHTHLPDRLSYSDAGTPQVHVGLDAWDMFPVSLWEATQTKESDE